MRVYNQFKIIDGLQIPEGAWLIAIYIEALYNSIPRRWSIQVIYDLLGECGKKSWNYNKFIAQILVFILMHNTFIFKPSHYLQVQGACCASSYANLGGGVCGSVNSFLMRIRWST